MQFQKLSFKNAAGQVLAARLDLPLDRKPAAYAIFAHCFTCTKSLNAVVNIDTALARAGIAVLRFDFTGLGESEGDFAETGLASNVTDLIAAAEFLESEFEAPRLLIGHSFGGAAVLRAAASIPSASAVALIAAPASFSEMRRLLGNSREQIEASGTTVLTLAGRTFKVGKQLLDDIDREGMEEAAAKLKKALLIFHSPMDSVVGIENAARIFRAAKHPKSFVSLDRADHLLSNRTDSLYVGSVLAAWARKYIGDGTGEESRSDIFDNRVVVRIGKRGYQTEITAGRHSLVADEPTSVGGADTGPSPYDYLLAALGSCTAMTLRMYADRKQWPLESVVVRLRHRKIHAEDCRGCDAEHRKIDLIEREIDPAGPLLPEQRQKILEIADKCPVHRTLQSPVRVKTWLAGQKETRTGE